MTLQLYNSLSRNKEPFVPQDPRRITMYACGPTVYAPPHIGNARAAITYDLLFRVLRTRFPEVVYARNVTDVDDKINAAAKAEGVTIDVITNRYLKVYHADMAALNALPPSVEPHATATMGTIIDMISRLIDNGHAYAADGHVMFNVPSDPQYGCLSGRSRDDMIAGARVEVAPYKRDPADFVLWKPSPDDLPGWDSPWGRGRPGWHIECSAMIERYLGTTIDIHGGGNDLKFPHHENELAQSRRCHDGAPLARYWVHTGFLQLDEEKMSKSLGNILLVENLRQKFPGEVIRYALLMARYREPLNWTEQLLQQARTALDQLYGAMQKLADIVPASDGARSAVDDALEDDLNTPEAYAALRAIARTVNTSTDVEELARCKQQLLSAAEQLGILQSTPDQWFTQSTQGAVDGARIDAMIEARLAARKARDFAAADRIRDELTAMGVQLLDNPDGTSQWRLKH